METKRERNRMAKAQQRARQRMLRRERKRSAAVEAMGWPLLEAFQKAQGRERTAVIRASLQTWRRG